MAKLPPGDRLRMRCVTEYFVYQLLGQHYGLWDTYHNVVVGNIEGGRTEVVDSRCSHVRISSWATLVSIVNGGESAKNISSWPPFIMLNDHDPAFTPERVLALLRNESVPTPPMAVAGHG